MKLPDGNLLRLTHNAAVTWKLDVDDERCPLYIYTDHSGVLHGNSWCTGITSPATDTRQTLADAVAANNWCHLCATTTRTTLCSPTIEAVALAAHLLTLTGNQITTADVRDVDAISSAAFLEHCTSGPQAALCQAALNHTTERLTPHLDTLREQHHRYSALFAAVQHHAQDPRNGQHIERAVRDLHWWDTNLTDPATFLAGVGAAPDTINTIVATADDWHAAPDVVAHIFGGASGTWLWPHALHRTGRVVLAPHATIHPSHLAIPAVGTIVTDLPAIAAIVDGQVVTEQTFTDIAATVRALRTHSD
jgi:hypothetical protein